MVTKYKQHEIESVAWRRPEKFKAQVHILTYSGAGVTDQWKWLHEEFDTQDEAEQSGIRFCMAEIDSRVRDCAVGS
jgi:hypothetical protein